MNLQAVRCLQHPYREAAARCPSCGRFFCRECVTEQEGRVLCAACLAASSATDGRRRGFLPGLAATTASLAGMLLLWGIFYYLGKALLRIPAAFHEGTFWNRF